MSNVTNLFDRIFDWEYIFRINNSKFANSLTIWLTVTPIIAVIVQYITTSNLLLSSSEPVTIELPLFIATIYVSALCILLSKLLSLSAPAIFLETRNFKHFEEIGMGVEQLNEFVEGVSKPANEGMQREGIRKVYWDCRRAQGVTRRKKRLLIAILHLVAVSAFIYTSFQSAVRVLEVSL